MAEDSRDRRSTDAGALAILFVVALSLRPQLVGAVTLIDDVSTDLGMSHAIAGFVGALPVLCMGVFALVAPGIRRAIGTRSTVTLSLALIALGGLARAASLEIWSFLALTIVVGVGIGVAGAVLPVVVRQVLPSKPVGGTASYSAGLQLGAAMSAATAAALAAQFGGWSGALAVLSVGCLVPLAAWLLAGPRDRQLSDVGVRLHRAPIDHAALTLALVFGLFGTVYYGLIAWLPDAYVEHGWSASSSGAIVAALNVASLIGALTEAVATGRLGDRVADALMGIGFAVAAAGFVMAPGAGFAWAILAGYTNGALLPLLLAQPVRVAQNPDQVAWLSAVMLGGGYTLAAIAPVALGAVRDATGTFGASFVVLALVSVVLAALTMVVGRQAAAGPGGTSGPRTPAPRPRRARESNPYVG
jgi:CP family cyanate transporter-like MFS transporter